MRSSHWMFLLAGAAAVLLVTPTARAAVKAQNLKYTVGGKEHVGFLAYDDTPGKRPGVLIAPEWAGVNDYARGRARQLAGMGYAALVLDPYGGGRNAADAKQSAEWSNALKNDRPELRRRVTTAFDALKKQPQVDPAKTAAIGYCFGGTAVLELARTGADVLGVVSFHGGLSTTLPAKPGGVKAKVLVCHGADDPFVPPTEVAAFEKEMREAKADWQFVSYGNSVHSFTNPEASKRGTAGVAYNEKADRRSWEAMKTFLAEQFGDSPIVGALGPAGGIRKGPVAEPPAEGPFAHSGNARKIVFVCDATGTMHGKLETLKRELTKAIAGLQPDQSYNIIFFTDGGRVKIADAKRLIAATADNKRNTTLFMNDVEAGGTTDPIAALDAAFRLNPNLLYFLTDGDFSNLRSNKEVIAAIARLNIGKRVKINTILFDAMEPGAEAVMKQLAADNGGSYRFVRQADLK